MGQRVLVVDDDLFLRDIYKETLTDAGYDVTARVDGEQGIAELMEGGYDLCLLDMMLPKFDGLGVLDHMAKNTPKKKNGPIIVLTNLSHEKLINDAMEKGAKSYIVKADVTPDMLLAEVKKYIAPPTS